MLQERGYFTVLEYGITPLSLVVSRNLNITVSREYLFSPTPKQSVIGVTGYQHIAMHHSSSLTFETENYLWGSQSHVLMFSLSASKQSLEHV